MQCSQCGTINDAYSKFCMKCGNPLAAATIARPPEPVLSLPAEFEGIISKAFQQHIKYDAYRLLLNSQIAAYANKGFELVMRDYTTAQMVKRKTIGFLTPGVIGVGLPLLAGFISIASPIAGIALLGFDFWLLLILLLGYLASTDQSVFLYVDTGGQVQSIPKSK